MQQYVAREIIRQHASEMRTQAIRHQVARWAREARQARKEVRQERKALNGHNADGSRETGRDQVATAKVVPLQRVPDGGDASSWDAGPRSHAC